MPNEGAKTKKRKAKRPRCHTCDKPIHVPKGWSAGSAVRRHYWRHHPAVMQAGAGKESR